MIFAPIWSIGDWRVHKEAIVSFGPCSYPTQKLRTRKEAAWKCYTMALEEISISTTRVGRIYWLYGADANYDQHGDVVRVQARQIKISILGTYVTSHQASSRSRWLSRDKLMTHMPVKANEVFYYKQPRNKSSGAPRWTKLHRLEDQMYRDRLRRQYWLSHFSWGIRRWDHLAWQTQRGRLGWTAASKGTSAVDDRVRCGELGYTGGALNIQSAIQEPMPPRSTMICC